MKTFWITIGNGEKKDTFALRASDAKTARRTAEISHIGSGWDVVRVTEKK